MEERQKNAEDQVLAAIRGYRSKRRIGFAILAIGLVSLILYFVTAMKYFPLAMGSFVFMFVGTMIAGKYSRDAKNSLSSGIVTEVLREVFDTVEYYPFGTVPDEIIASAHMEFPFSYDKIEGSDYIRAIYKGLEIKLSDVEFSRVGEDNEETVFHGQWMTCDLDRELTGEVHVCPITGKNRKKLPKDRILLWNDVFNERYLVLADYEHEAFEVLTPRAVDAVMSIADRSGGEVYLCFQRGKVHIAISSDENFFELDATTIDTAELRQKTRNDLRWYLDIIDELELIKDSE